MSSSFEKVAIYRVKGEIKLMKNGQVEKFARYSQFKSVAEFNDHVNKWLQEVGREFSKGERLALNYLTRYAVKIVGVANVKIGTVLKTIHADYNGNGVSRSTWKRMIVKAKKLGMIVTHELARENGSQSSNLYVFMPYQDSGSKGTPNDELPKPKILDHLNKTNLEKTKTIKDINKRNYELDHTFTSDKVPSLFVQLVKAFYDRAKDIEEFWRMTEIAAYKYVYEHDVALKLDIAIQAFKQTIRRVKTGAIKKPIAYFYAIALSKFGEAYHDDLDEVAMNGEEGTKYIGVELSWLNPGARHLTY